MIPIPTYRTRRGMLLCSAAYAPYRMPWLFGPTRLFEKMLLTYPAVRYHPDGETRIGYSQNHIAGG